MSVHSYLETGGIPYKSVVKFNNKVWEIRAIQEEVPLSRTKAIVNIKKSTLLLCTYSHNILSFVIYFVLRFVMYLLHTEST